MAGSGDMTARQRRHVHMHTSSVFGGGDVPQGSVGSGGEAYQRKAYQSLEGKLRENNCAAPDMQLSRPADLRCTQNADHAAVIPGSRGGPELGEKLTPRMSRAVGADEGMPRECWGVATNLQWHDTRHQRCRQRDSGAQRPLTAEEAKRQDLSSELFGQRRMTDPSMNRIAARQDLRPDAADYLTLDSTLQRNQGLLPNEANTAEDPRGRASRSLAAQHPSINNTMSSPRRRQGLTPDQAKRLDLSSEMADYGRNSRAARQDCEAAEAAPATRKEMDRLDSARAQVSKWGAAGQRPQQRDARPTGRHQCTPPWA